MDYVGGVGTCCTNKSSDDEKCVAPVPECFHRSGPQRCDVLLKYFGTMDYDGEHARTPPCAFRGEPYACDDLRCDPASGALYYVCLLYTSPSPRDATLSRMPSSA